MDFRPEIAPLSSIMNPELFLIWDDGLMTSPMTSMLASAHPTPDFNDFSFEQPLSQGSLLPVPAEQSEKPDNK